MRSIYPNRNSQASTKNGAVSPPDGHGVNSVCLLCGGSGWRPVDPEAVDKKVTRCECRKPRVRGVEVLEPCDYKSLAAGDR